MNQQAMFEELRSLGAATVYEAQGATGALDGGIKPIDPASRLVGPALTVDTRPADNLMLHYALFKAGRAMCWWSTPRASSRRGLGEMC